MCLVNAANNLIVSTLSACSSSGVGAPYAYRNFYQPNGVLYACTPSSTLTLNIGTVVGTFAGGLSSVNIVLALFTTSATNAVAGI